MTIENLSELLYARQFVLTPKEINPFLISNWIHSSINNSYHIYSHPNLPITQIKEEDIQLTLLGYIIDPNCPYKSNKEVLRGLLENAPSVKSILISQEALGGRYIIVVNKGDEVILFNDACGLRQVYYFIDSKRNTWCCSQTSLLSEIIELEKDDFIIDNFVKKVFVKQKEYLWPGDLSEYKGVKKLLPNHLLNLKNGESLRFFPNEPLVPISLQDGISKASVLLRQIMESVNMRFSLALPLTSGFDSRTILAACNGFQEKIFYYTLLYPPNQVKSPDIAIPKKILSELGLKHHIINCTTPMQEWFSDIYRRNVSYAHSYWGDIAFGMYDNYPDDRICLKGNCSEIGKCVSVIMDSRSRLYYEEENYDLKKNISIFLSGIEWKNNSISIDIINEWLKDAKKVEQDFNFHPLDLFIWEHEMGNWQAMSQLEWDVVQESFTPFNNRALLSILLSVNYKYRMYPDYRLLKEIIKHLWPQLINYPFNPSSFLINAIKKTLNR